MEPFRRLAFLSVLLAFPAAAGETTPLYPLWDGQESVAEYARRTGLEPVRTFTLAPDVTLEMVLIPAGRFKMGAPDAVLPERSMEYARLRLILSSALVFSLVGWVLFRSIRMRRRPQFSLAYLVRTTCATTLCVWSVLDFHAVQAEWAWYGECLTRSAAMDPNTKPAHGVTLTRPFYLAKYEFTQAQYRAATGSEQIQFIFHKQGIPKETFLKYPVTLRPARVEELLGILRERFQVAFRLPSEAEWEFSCRSGSRGSFCRGHDSDDINNMMHRIDFVGPVGQQSPNSFGLYDMRSNLWEWCADWYAPYTANEATDPHGPPVGGVRVVRGGRRSDASEPCAECCRWKSVDGCCDRANAGLRIALDLRDIETVQREVRSWDQTVVWRGQQQALQLHDGEVTGNKLEQTSNGILREGGRKGKPYFEVTQVFRPDPADSGLTSLQFSLLEDADSASRVFQENVSNENRLLARMGGSADSAFPLVGDGRFCALRVCNSERCVARLMVRRERMYFSVTCIRSGAGGLPTTHLLEVCRALIARYDALESKPVLEKSNP